MKTLNQFIKEKVDMTKPGWMLKADPELGKKIKAKQKLEKKRQDSYGDPSKGISDKGLVSEAESQPKNSKQAAKDAAVKLYAAHGAANYDHDHDRALTALQAHPELHAKVKTHLDRASTSFQNHKKLDNEAESHYLKAKNYKVNNISVSARVKHADDYAAAMKESARHHEEGLKHQERAMHVLHTHIESIK
jgi:hypothetical protein